MLSFTNTPATHYEMNRGILREGSEFEIGRMFLGHTQNPFGTLVIMVRGRDTLLLFC